ncbi:MAG: hypothetical protein K2I42_06430, partial [Anaeroplasmataceae bacterium]|nr:hypothetical protein [Anaeroplasmataceae bacterium]
MKKKIIFLSIFIFVLLVGGVGIYFYTQTHRDPITWADESKYKTYTEPAPTDGSLPTDYDSYMNMAYMLWTLEHAENFSSTTRGTAVSVGQTQEILNRRIVNKDKQVVETYSGGLITLGKQKYFINNRVLLRDYATKNGETFTWKMDEPECITEDTYKQRYGWFPTQSTAYIICNETILELSDIKVLENGLYSITLSLNPGENFAPFWYAREVWTNASSLSKPAFSSIELEYIFDANWRIHKVNTKEKYKVTPKVAPIPVDCVTNIEEIFDYENYKIEDSTIQFFDQYKDMQPADGEISSEPDSPLSYITGALLSSNEEKKFDLTIDVNGNEISGQMALNLSDLNQIGVKVRFGNFQVVYQNDTVYIDFGANKIKLNQKEFMELLAPILEDTTTTESADFSSIFDINLIMSEISAAQITKENDLVTIDMVLHLFGLELPIQFKIKESGQVMDLISISASIKCNDVQVDVLLSANPNATFLDVTGEYNDTKNLKFIIDDIIKIIKNKELGINFNFKWNDFDITMNAFLNWNSKLAVQADFILKKLDIEESFRITYYNEVIYLDYHNIKIKLTLEQAKEILDSNLTLPEDLDLNVDINEILSTLMTLNFENILKYISINENELLFGLDLSMFIKDINQIDVKIADSENGFDFINESYGIQISILSQIDHLIEVEESK